MNNLHLHAVRRHAAYTFHRSKASNGIASRSHGAVPVSLPHEHTAPALRAQWSRHPVTGALECHWIPQQPEHTLPRPYTVRHPSLLRVHRHFHRAGIRPPLRHFAHG